MCLRLGSLFSLTICAVLVTAGCEESSLDGVISCHPSDRDTCPQGYVCKPFACPTDYRCYARQPEDLDVYPMGCVVDGVCDADLCETYWSCSDCSDACDPALVASAPQDFLVSAYRAIFYDPGVPDIGVDLDGDGEIDNRWGLIAHAINERTRNDLDQEIALDIESGRLLLVARVFGDYPADTGPASLVQLLAGVSDATPVFDGSDEVRLALDASVDVGLCGPDSERLYGRPFTSGTLRFPIPWPDVGGTVLVELHQYIVQGDVTAAGWQEVDVGGCISHARVYDELLPRLAELINHIISSDPDNDESRTLVSLFDGNCVVLEHIPGCESIVNGEGACEGDVDPPVITVSELKCNALVNSALRPDIDTDGDGEPDAISFGARLRAVPVTVVEN